MSLLHVTIANSCLFILLLLFEGLWSSIQAGITEERVWSLSILHGQRGLVGEPALKNAACPQGERHVLVVLVWVLVFTAVRVAVVHVLGVRAGVREALATFVTLVGFLSGVQPAVLNQVVLMLEGLVADLALMRTLACNEYRDVTSNIPFKNVRKSTL